jgi:hypothetical protein
MVLGSRRNQHIPRSEIEIENYRALKIGEMAVHRESMEHLLAESPAWPSSDSGCITARPCKKRVAPGSDGFEGSSVHRTSQEELPSRQVRQSLESLSAMFLAAYTSQSRFIPLICR